MLMMDPLPRRLSLSFALCAAATAAAAQESSPNIGWVPRPNPAGGTWVADPSSHLASDTRYRVNQEISALRRATGAEIAVVIVDSTAGLRSSEFAVALRDAWGIGQGNDKGILMLVVPSRRDLRLIVGRGLQQVLTGERLARIEDEAILAEFRRRDLNAGVLRGVRELISAAREAAGGRGTTTAATTAAATTAAPRRTTTTPPAPGLATLAGQSPAPTRQAASAPRTTPISSSDSAKRAATVAAAFGSEPGTVQRLSAPAKQALARSEPARPAAPMSTRTTASAAQTAAASTPPAPVLRNAPPAVVTPPQAAPRTADSAAGRAIAVIGTLISTPTRAAVVASTLLLLGAAIGALGFRGLTNRRAVCPACARRALRAESRVAREAGAGMAGAELVTERCGYCKWTRQYEQVIPALPAAPTRRLSGPMLPPAQTPPRVSSGISSGISSGFGSGASGD